MKRALLTAVLMVTWPFGALATMTPGADADGPRRASDVRLPRQVDEARGTAAGRVARDESIWSEPFYRYGHREPAMEELAPKGDSPESGAVAHTQPPH
jgi:hypothetical protein